MAASSSSWTRYTRLTLSMKRMSMKTKVIFIQYSILATMGFSEMKLRVVQRTGSAVGTRRGERTQEGRT